MAGQLSLLLRLRATLIKKKARSFILSWGFAPLLCILLAWLSTFGSIQRNPDDVPVLDDSTKSYAADISTFVAPWLIFSNWRLAVVSDTPGTRAKFINWAKMAAPGLNMSDAPMLKQSIPGLVDIIAPAQTWSDVESLVQQSDYDSNPDSLRIAAALELSDTPPSVTCNVRFNSSLTGAGTSEANSFSSFADSSSPQFSSVYSPAFSDDSMTLPSIAQLHALCMKWTMNSSLPDTAQSADDVVQAIQNSPGMEPFIDRNKPSSGYNPSAVLAAGRLALFTPQVVHVVGQATHASVVNTFLQSAGSSLRFAVVGFISIYSLFINSVVEEKEKKIREGLRTMGMNVMMLNASWFIVFWIALMLASAVCSIALTALVFTHTGFIYLFGMFALGTTACLLLCLLSTVFFQRAKAAGMFGTLGYLLLFLPVYAASSIHTTAGHNAMCLAAPACIASAIDLVTSMESGGAGLNAGSMSSQIDGASMASIFTMLAVDILLYGSAFLYLDAVWPAEFGVPQKPGFLCTARFWSGVFGGRRAGHSDDNLRGHGVLEMTRTGSSEASDELHTALPESVVDEALSNEVAQSRYIQPVDSEQRNRVIAGRAVLLQGLTKVFQTPDGEKTAVSNLHLSMFEGAITILLGPNGSGKSTTLNMLTGMLPPSSGTANVFGKDIGLDMSAIRRFVGVCPQHDVLWDELSVRRTLEFFAELKGVAKAHVPEEVQRVAHQIGLSHKLDVNASDMSGGQKRKLSLGIAIIGGSRVLIVDEASSGLDPSARRDMWELLRELKSQGKLLVCTTHYMDEAAALGDKVAIMANGVMQCEGTPLYLKEKYGVGYMLTLMRATQGRHVPGSTMLQAVQRHVPDAELQTDAAAEVRIRLPLDQTAKFPALLRALGQSSDELGIQNLGVSATSLEEVFMKVSEGAHLEAAKAAAGSKTVPTASGSAKAQHDPGAQGKTDAELLQEIAERARAATFGRHFWAMVLKRFHSSRRSVRTLIFQVVLPLGIMMMALGLMKAANSSQAQPLALTSAALRPALLGLQHDPANIPVFKQLAGVAIDGVSALYADQYPDVPPAQMSAFNRMASAGGVNVQVVRPSQAAASTADSPFWTKLVEQRNSAGTYAPSVVNASVWLLRTAQPAPSFVTMMPVQLHGSAVPQSIVPAAGLLLALNASSTWAGLAATTMWADSMLHGIGSFASSVQPLPLTLREQQAQNQATGLGAVVALLYGWSMFATSYVSVVLLEKEGGSLHQQLISGARPAAYWLGNFAVDYALYLIAMTLAIAEIYLFDIQAWTSTVHTQSVAMFLLLALFGVSAAGFAYMMSQTQSTQSTGRNVLVLISFVSIFLVIGSFIMGLLPSTCKTNESLQPLFNILPLYSLGRGMLRLSLYQQLPILDQICDAAHGGSFDHGRTYHGALDMNVSGSSILALAITGVLYMALTIGLNYAVKHPTVLRTLMRLTCHPGAGTSNRNSQGFSTVNPLGRASSAEVEDDDVRNEHARCEDPKTQRTQAVTVSHLRKTYRNGTRAVRDISVSVKLGEVFGLCGLNGAGKSTLFGMLSGDILPTAGKATLGGYDMEFQQHSIRRILGYCAQRDALFELLTVREHLEFYARLKGVPSDRLSSVVEAMIDDMTLREFANKLAGSLSGGNKRKLGAAIALIMSPPLVLLDEISAGVDVAARKALSIIIARIANERRESTIILTSHAMEEVSALANRVCIMAHGHMRCIGTLQHLKNKYGRGYSLDLRIRSMEEEDLQRANSTVEQAARQANVGTPGATPAAGQSAGSLRFTLDELRSLLRTAGQESLVGELGSSGSGWFLAAACTGGQKCSQAQVASWLATEHVATAISERIRELFPGAELVERQGDAMRWTLPNVHSAGHVHSTQEFTEAMASVFARMEETRQIGVVEYAVSQTDLEQIFNMFAHEDPEGAEEE